MNDETPFHHTGADGARYSVDVIRDRRDEENPHYDVDLVRSLTGRFGEALEQRLTLAEHDQRSEADAHCQGVEWTITEEGLSGLGDAEERIRREPMLYDGTYLFVTYPPDAEPGDRAAATLLHVDTDGLHSEQLAVGDADTMERIIAEGERDWAEGKLPNILPDPARHDMGTTGFTRDDTLAIHDRAGEEWAAHLDGSGTSHWFAIVESPAAEDPFELRYFRALEGEGGGFKHDSYPVLPLPDDRRESAWPLPGLEMYLERGDVYMAQQFAHDVADNNGLLFPEPLDIPALDPKPEYYFGYGVGPHNDPALETVKTWMDGAERRFDTFTIAEYGTYEEAKVDEQELEALMQRDGLEAALNLAENMAVAGGYLDPKRADGRVFSADDAPADLFTTIRERELTLPDIDTEPLIPITPEYLNLYSEAAEEARLEREANAGLEGAAWFEATFAKPERELLQPLDDTVNYAVVVQEADPWTLELAVEKYWKEPNGYLGMSSLTVETYDSADGTQREAADAARQGLLEVHDERGLEALMHQAELNAMANGGLDGGRTDPRLFREGPPDRFETLAQQLADEPNPYWNVGEDRAVEVPVPGSWDELMAQQPDEDAETERHYWQMHYRPVETPEGESLGTALFVTEFPQLSPDFDDYMNENGMDDSLYPTEARTLEMAHFANDEDARKFETEFRSYLVPGLLDGPELAPEVAKLEGLSGEWEDMDYRGIVDYMSGSRTIVREESDWHLHNPNAEREAQSKAEGEYPDPIYSVSDWNCDDAATHIEPPPLELDM